MSETIDRVELLKRARELSRKPMTPMGDLKAVIKGLLNLIEEDRATLQRLGWKGPEEKADG